MMTLAWQVWGRYSPLLLAPFRQRLHTGELLVWLVLLLVAACAVYITAIAVGLGAAGKLMGFVSLPALLIGWCICFDGLREQNHPHVARLVPGHLARLRRCAMGLLLSMSCLVAVVFGAATGQPLLWGLGAASAMVLTAVCMRWWWLWLPLSLLPGLVFWPPLNALVQLLWSGLQHWYLMHTASLVVTAALLLPCLLSRLLQDGGAAHRRNYRRQAALRLMLAGKSGAGPAKPIAGFGFGRGIGRLFAWPFAPWRDHLLRVARPEARSAMARAELASLGNLHWTCILGALSMLGLMLAVVAVWVELLHAPDWSALGRPNNFGLQLGIVCSALNPLLGVTGVLYRSRREQALLMLLPGMPRGAALNRLMARRMLMQFYMQWGFALALIVALLSWGGGEHYSRLGVHALLAVLPMGGLLLRDWSRQTMQSPVRLALPLAICLLGTGLFFGLAVMGLSLWTLAVVSLLLSAGLLIWRWPRYVGRGPCAMPVGRWA